jgi:hypothetical protein
MVSLVRKDKAVNDLLDDVHSAQAEVCLCIVLVFVDLFG